MMLLHCTALLMRLWVVCLDHTSVASAYFSKLLSSKGELKDVEKPLEECGHCINALFLTDNIPRPPLR